MILLSVVVAPVTAPVLHVKMMSVVVLKGTACLIRVVVEVDHSGVDQSSLLTTHW